MVKVNLSVGHTGEYDQQSVSCVSCLFLYNLNQLDFCSNRVMHQNGFPPIPTGFLLSYIFWCSGERLKAINISEFLPFTFWHWDGSKVSFSKNMDYKMESPCHPLPQLNLIFIFNPCLFNWRADQDVCPLAICLYIISPEGAVNIWRNHYEGVYSRRKKMFQKNYRKQFRWTDISERSKKHNTKYMIHKSREWHIITKSSRFTFCNLAQHANSGVSDPMLQWHKKY